MFKRLILAVAFSLGAAVALAIAVSAHSRPIRFDPAPGAVLAAAPAKVDGWFTADIRRDPNWSFLRVADAQGNRVDTGETVLSQDRRMMSVSLRSGLAPGRYLVTWRTYDDADGAIFGDCYTFFVGQAAADAAVSERSRLDGGSACQRIDVEAREGTPVPGQTPASDDDHGEGENEHAEDSNGGVPLWGLIVGVAVGLTAGLVGGRYLAAARG